MQIVLITPYRCTEGTRFYFILFFVFNFFKRFIAFFLVGEESTVGKENVSLDEISFPFWIIGVS